jgi:hypothetical protein
VSDALDDPQVILPTDPNRVHRLATDHETVCGMEVRPEDLTTVIDIVATHDVLEKEDDLSLCEECFPPHIRRNAGGGKAYWVQRRDESGNLTSFGPRVNDYMAKSLAPGKTGVKLRPNQGR